MMQHRHFVLIAATIADLPQEQREEIARHFADKLAATNPGFNHARFIAAAMGQPMTKRDAAK